MIKYPSDLLKLMAFLKKLPGVGSRTAERFAFHLLDWEKEQTTDFATLLATIKDKITHCPNCRCLMEKEDCLFCKDPQRNPHQLCIVSSVRDVFAIEETGAYNGLYHVLGGLLSPLHGYTPQHLDLHHLKKRVASLLVKEAILAFDATLEGDATALYLKEQITAWGLTVSRLAFGLPMGSSLDFVDGNTLLRALTGRHSF